VTDYQIGATYVDWEYEPSSGFFSIPIGVNLFFPYPFICEGVEEATPEGPDASFVTPIPTSTVDLIQPIVFDVTNRTGPLSRVLVSATESVSWAQELVFDGANFTPRYTANSYCEAIENGVRWHALPNAGWPRGREVKLRVFLHGTFGVDVVETTPNVDVVVFSYPYPEECPNAPEVIFDAPIPGTSILPADTIIFRVIASSGVSLPQILVAVGSDSQIYELAFDGEFFTSRFLGSSREVVPNGWRYHLVRVGGWSTGAVDLKVFATDSAGHTL
jgi:hypothetical protein